MLGGCVLEEPACMYVMGACISRNIQIWTFRPSDLERLELLVNELPQRCCFCCFFCSKGNHILEAKFAPPVFKVAAFEVRSGMGIQLWGRADIQTSAAPRAVAMVDDDDSESSNFFCGEWFLASSAGSATSSEERTRK